MTKHIFQLNQFSSQVQIFIVWNCSHGTFLKYIAGGIYLMDSADNLFISFVCILSISEKTHLTFSLHAVMVNDLQKRVCSYTCW